MSLFSKFFGKRKSEAVLAAEKIVSEVKRQTEAERAPFRRLTSAIIHAANECEKRMAPLIGGDTDRERLIREMLVLHEFLFFFLFLTDERLSQSLVPTEEPSFRRLYFPILPE
jgi:hypothetical protein